MASETNAKKRSRETEEYLLVHLVGAYGDTSSFPCIVHKVTGEDDPITGKGLHRSTPTSRLAAGTDFYDDQGELLDGWSNVDEDYLREFTHEHHCTMVIAYLDD